MDYADKKRASITGNWKSYVSNQDAPSYSFSLDYWSHTGQETCNSFVIVTVWFNANVEEDECDSYGLIHETDKGCRFEIDKMTSLLFQ